MHRKKLDRKRSFSSIHGTGCPYFFEQDGRYFQANGEECGPDGEWPLKDAPAESSPEPTVSKPLGEMRYGELRTLYTQLTKKGLKVGISKDDLIKMIQEVS